MAATVRMLTRYKAVGDMLYQAPTAFPANDLPVFLRQARSG